MLKQPIYISGLGSISAIGSSESDLLKAYENPAHYLSVETVAESNHWVARLPDTAKEEIDSLRNLDSKYKSLDNSVLFAIAASRKAIKQSGWLSNPNSKNNFGVNIGSSRGATGLFESYHQEYLNHKKVPTLASPTTTLGNIASWVGHDLGTQGPVISHSITCSTALHALLNGVAWLQSGMTTKFLVGGSEAPLTPFTIAQMKALKIYATYNAGKDERKPFYPCAALDLNKTRNSMVLGEGAAVACLSSEPSRNSLAKIVGIGYATELLNHNVSISTDAKCFQDSMGMAMGTLSPNQIDAVVMHAPGTVKGDSAEFKAIEKIFCNNIPALTTNKWKVGHTFGASGMLSLEMATLMLQHQKFFPVPFVTYNTHPKKLEHILVNAVGFGGNAVSVLLQRI